MELTYKAIARMAGYRVCSNFASFPHLELPWATYHHYSDVIEGYISDPFPTEYEAYKMCCIENGLVAK